MAFSRRHILKWAVAGTVASGLAPKASFLECLRAKSLPIKLGVTERTARNRFNAAINKLRAIAGGSA